MLNKWIKDIFLVILTASILNTVIYILGDQLSIIGIWELDNTSSNEVLEGNRFDIIALNHDFSFTHSTNETVYHGVFYRNEDRLIMVYDDNDYVFIVDMKNKVITHLESGNRYKKITLFE